jgi:hypothetical protein
VLNSSEKTLGVLNSSERRKGLLNSGKKMDILRQKE